MEELSFLHTTVLLTKIYLCMKFQVEIQTGAHNIKPFSLCSIQKFIWMDRDYYGYLRYTKPPFRQEGGGCEYNLYPLTLLAYEIHEILNFVSLFVISYCRCRHRQNISDQKSLSVSLFTQNSETKHPKIRPEMVYI